MSVVSNTTPVLYLAKIDRLRILRDTYSDILVSTPVWQELVSPLLHGKPIPKDVPPIIDAREQGWLKVKDASSKDALRVMNELSAEGFGMGEASSISLAYEVRTVLLANDAAAISASKRYKVQTKWLTEVLHDALVKGVMKTGEEYESILTSAIKAGLYLSKKEKDKAVSRAYELAGRK